MALKFFRRNNNRIKVDENSCTFKSHTSAVIENVSISLKSHSKMVISEGAIIKNASFYVANESTVVIGKDVRIVGKNDNNSSKITVDNGMFLAGEKALLQGKFLVRFGGKLTIGDHTGFSGVELRCEEQISVGSYCLFASGVTLFDTNTHSVDWQKRREVIKKGFPGGAKEYSRPRTESVIIGNDVWVGKGSSILKGARIGDRVVIGLGVIVPAMNIPADSKVINPKPIVI